MTGSGVPNPTAAQSSQATTRRGDDGPPPVGAPALDPAPDSAPPSIPSAAHSEASLVNHARPAFSAILTGHVIAKRYEVLGVLGEGGMGIVYRCRDQATGDHVAIKRVIPPEGKLAKEYIQWFYKEARALASLEHPGIVHARDFGQLDDGTPYLAMELVTGPSLHDLNVARLSWPLIWSIVDQILSALAQAHSRGVVHGDLKPSNVIVSEKSGAPPQVHILDFGLAWLRVDPHDERLDGEKSMDFAPHAGAGTPGYMAPEQIQHEMHHVCGATDLYSLACVLFKMLSGNSPFSGDPDELLKLHAYRPPPKLEVAVDAPAGVIDFVNRLLAKRPWDRFEYSAEARRAWQPLKPQGDIAPSLWQFPPNVRSKKPVPATRASDDPGSSSGLAPGPERAPGLLGIRPSPLVGRHEVRQRLRAIADEVIAGTGPSHRLVILLGPAGVGKSRIGEWLFETIHEEGRMVPLEARYRRVRGSLDGMLGAVTKYFNFEHTDRSTIENSLMARWAVRKDDRNMRAWVAGTGEWLRPSPPGGGHVGPSGIRFALDSADIRRQVTRFALRRIANKRPLLFLLDDLHHAAANTFEGLERIHETEKDQPILMVATVRAEDVQLGTPAAELLRKLRESLAGEVIEIDPMDRDTTCELLHASLPLDDEAANEAAKRSRGFPLFALQQLHAWANEGSMNFVDGSYRVPSDILAMRPRTTAELWDARVRAVPLEHRMAADAVSTLGIDIRRPVLHALLTALGIPPDGAIVSLQNAELILPRGPGRYSWPHALLQEHLFRRLTKRPDAKKIFIAAANALKRHALANTRRIVRQRVLNLLYAKEADEAARVSFQFIEQAWNGAREPAATLADLDLLSGRLSGRSHALENRWRAESLRHVGRMDEAKGHAEGACAIFEKLDDRPNTAHCLRLLGNIASNLGRSDEAIKLVGRAHQIFTEIDDTLGLAQCELVVGEIQHLLGNYPEAREVTEYGERHFASLEQALGRGQCLLLLSWIENSEGAAERSRRLTLEAQAEFEQAGYRLGLAQTTASLAHIEHRLNNYYSAERQARESLALFSSLRSLRGQAASQRLLAMVHMDTDTLGPAEKAANEALRLHSEMGDPWGEVESKLLLAQIALAARDTKRATQLLTNVRQIPVEEPEPRQHYLLTKAWLLFESKKVAQAFEAMEAASGVFSHMAQAGDHTPHLLRRLARFTWPRQQAERISAWRTLLDERAKQQDD